MEKKPSTLKKLLRYSLMGLGGLLVLSIILSVISGGRCNAVTEKIIGGIIKVEASSYQGYSFTVPVNGATIKGSFLTSGGGGNDIAVYIFDKNNYINWQNGHESQIYYNSGKITTGDINQILPSGVYYLVYDNGFSILTPKEIRTDVSYSYCY